MKTYFLCTAKLRKELGVKDKELSSPIVNDGSLSAWYADLIRIGSKKSIIFVHPETRYILVALDRRRADIRYLSCLFQTLLKKVLLAEGVDRLVIEGVIGESSQYLIAKTIDRSVVGTMTEMVQTIRWKFRGGCICA